MTQLLDNPYEMRAEIWRPYPLNTDYLVSNLGKIKLESRLRKDGRKLQESILKLSKNGVYGILKNGKKTQITPTKAVREAFFIKIKEIASLENEIWEGVDGYDDYKVSNLGRVISIKNHSSWEGRVIKPQPKSFGHVYVRLRRNNSYKGFAVHRLVANAFIPNSDLTRNWINHINSNPSDNRVENLEWVTARENKYHGKGMGKNPCIIFKKGKYTVKTQYEKKPHYIGSFLSLEEAIKARNNFFKERNIINKYLE